MEVKSNAAEEALRKGVIEFKATYLLVRYERTKRCLQHLALTISQFSLTFIHLATCIWISAGQKDLHTNYRILAARVQRALVDKTTCANFFQLYAIRRHVPRRRRRSLIQESQTGSMVAFVLSWRIYAFAEKILSREIRVGEGCENCEVSWILIVERQKNEIEAGRYAIFDYRYTLTGILPGCRWIMRIVRTEATFGDSVISLSVIRRKVKIKWCNSTDNTFRERSLSVKTDKREEKEEKGSDREVEFIKLSAAERCYRAMDTSECRSGQGKVERQWELVENGLANLWNMAASPEVGDLSEW